MAYHDSTVTTNTNVSVTQIVANMPATTVGDYLCTIITQDSDPAPTYSCAGWVQIDQGTVTADGQTMTYFEFTGGAPSSPPASYTFTTTDGGEAQALVASFSGRTLSRTFLTQTANSSSNPSPVTAVMAGGTSATGDDLLVVIAIDKTDGGSAWSFGTPTGTPGTFILQQNVDVGGEFVGIGFGTINNIAAGPTGSISDVITRTAGSDGIGYIGWVVSLASSGSGPVANSTQGLLLSLI